MVSPWCCQGYWSVSTTVMGCCHGNPSCYCEDCGGIFPRKGITCNMCSHILKRVHLQSHGCSQRALRTVKTRDQNQNACKKKSCTLLLACSSFIRIVISKKNKKPQGPSVSKLLNTHTHRHTHEKDTVRDV